MNKRKILFFLILVQYNFHPAFAQRSNPSNAILKESYLPQTSEFLFLGGLNFDSTKTSLNGPAGKVVESDGISSDLKLKGGFGWTEKLMLGLQSKYLISSKRDNAYGSGSTLNGTKESLASKGIQEPELFGIYRFYDNSNSNLKGNLEVGASFKLQPAKYATTTSDGNAGLGGNQFRIAAEIIKEINFLEIYFKINRSIYSVQKFEDASDSQKYNEYSDRQTSEITIGALNQFSENFSLGGNFSLQFSDSYSNSSYSNSQLSTKLNYDSATATAINVSGKYKILESSVLIVELNRLLSISQTASVGNSKLSIGDSELTNLSMGWLQSF